jgi:hypothetical protein
MSTVRSPPQAHAWLEDVRGACEASVFGADTCDVCPMRGALAPDKCLPQPLALSHPRRPLAIRPFGRAPHSGMASPQAGAVGRGQKRGLLKDLESEALQRIVKELKRCPAKVFAAERLVMGERLLEEDDSEKPYPDGYNVFKLIPKDDKKAQVISYKPRLFSDETCLVMLAKDKDIFVKLFYFLHCIDAKSTVPKAARDKAVFRRMLTLRYTEVCAEMKRPLIDEFTVEPDGTLSFPLHPWWWTLATSDNGAKYTAVQHLSGLRVEFDVALPTKTWALENPWEHGGSFVCKKLPNKQKAMQQECATFFEEALLAEYSSKKLASIAYKIRQETTVPRSASSSSEHSATGDSGLLALLGGASTPVPPVVPPLATEEVILEPG